MREDQTVQGRYRAAVMAMTGRGAALALGVPLVLGLALLIAPSRPVVVPLRLASGQIIRAEVAETARARGRGLMFRRSLPDNEGMLFVFPSPGHHAIWMKNCRFAIDVVWLDANHRVVDMAESLQPCLSDPCPVYRSMPIASFAVELNAGDARRHRIRVGGVLAFAPPNQRRLGLKWRRTVRQWPSLSGT